MGNITILEFLVEVFTVNTLNYVINVLFDVIVWLNKINL